MSSDGNGLVYEDKNVIWACVKEGLSFMDVQKEFLVSKPKPMAQSYTSNLCCSWELISSRQNINPPQHSHAWYRGAFISVTGA
jgi:hypothetical protein